MAQKYKKRWKVLRRKVEGCIGIKDFEAQLWLLYFKFVPAIRFTALRFVPATVRAKNNRHGNKALNSSKGLRAPNPIEWIAHRRSATKPRTMSESGTYANNGKLKLYQIKKGFQKTESLFVFILRQAQDDRTLCQ